MPEKSPFRCPAFSCCKMFTSVSWQLKHIKLRYSEHLQVAHKENLTIRSTPQPIEPAQHREFNANEYSVDNLNKFPYDEHLEPIAVLESQPLSPLLSWTEIYPSASPSLSNYIAELWECDAPRCPVTNLQNNPHYPFTTCEEYKCIQWGIKKKGMKT